MKRGWARLLRTPLREIGAYGPGASLDELMARHGLESVGAGAAAAS